MDRTDLDEHLERELERLNREQERELAFLSEKYGTENHAARIRPAYFCLMVWIAVFALALYGSLTEPRIPANRRPLAIGLSIAGLVTGVLLMFAPKSWLRLIGEIGGGGDPIESIFSNECKVVDNWVWIKQVAIVCVLLPMALVGLNLFNGGNVIVGIILLAIAIVGSILNFSQSIFKPASDFAKRLESVLKAEGYFEADKKSAAQFLKHSIIKSDSSLEISDFWANEIGKGPMIGWGRYSTSGDSMASGVFCLAEYRIRLPSTKFAETIGEFSSVHFDKETSSLFGTFNVSEDSSISLMAGLPWQYLNRTLICRIEHDVLLSTNKSENIDQEFIRQMVDCWALLGEQLAVESLATENNAES